MNYYFLTLFMLLIGTYPVQSGNELEDTLINEIAIRSNPSLNKTIQNDRKTAKQGGDIVEQAGNYWTGFASQITSTLDNLTLDNFLLESSKRIPEDTRVSLEMAISNLPEPLSSLLKGPLEQLNEFLQIGRQPPTNEPPYVEEASTFEPDFFTVAPPRYTYPTESSPPLNYTQRVFTETNPQKTPSFSNLPSVPNTVGLPIPPALQNSPFLQNTPNLQNIPLQNALNSQNSTLPPLLNRNRKPTPVPNNNSLSNLMLLINNQPFSNLFQNVSNTITNTRTETGSTETTVAHLFENISSQFHSTGYPPTAPNGEPIVDDEDESLPVYTAIKQSTNASNTNNINKFTVLHKQLVTELKALANSSNLPQDNYKTNINFPDNQISSGIYSNQQFSNNQGYPNSNNQQFSNSQGFQNPDGSQFSNNQGFQNSNEQQFSNNQGFQTSNGQQYSNNQGFQNSNGQQFSNNQGFQNTNDQQLSNLVYPNSNSQQFSDNQGFSNSNGQFSNNQGFPASNGQQFSSGQVFPISNGQQFSNGQIFPISNGQQFANTQGIPISNILQGNSNQLVKGQVAISDQPNPPPGFATPQIQIITIAGEPAATTTKRPVVVQVTERAVSTTTEDEDDGEDEDASSNL